MLLKYRVQNYKAIAHAIEYSMFPTQDEINENNIMTIETIQGTWSVLRRGALFGPNASGKSSFIQSIDFARDYIVEPQKSGVKTGITPFKGEFEDIGKDSTFQFMFYQNGDVFEYGFTLDAYRVMEEWLMKLTKKGFQPVFQRMTDKDGETQIELTSLAGRKDHKKRQIAELLKETMGKNQRNQLFLYKLSENAVPIAEKVMAWFEKIRVIFPSSVAHMLEMNVMENRDFADFLSEKLVDYDTGIDKIFARTKSVQLTKLLREMDIPQNIIDEISEKKEGLVKIAGRLFIFNEEDGEPMLCELILEHLLVGKAYQFQRDEESDGTKRLLDLFPVLFGLQEHSFIYFIDELDRCLHTKLTKKFVRDFVSASHNNQLIFTAHDINLISLDEMEQNEIWFIEKNRNGESYLKPFSDYVLNDAIKNGYSTIKSYLAGRFGAVPMIKEESGYEVE